MQQASPAARQPPKALPHDPLVRPRLAPGLTLLYAAVQAVVLGLSVAPARADAVTDWNQRSCALLTAAGMPTQPAIRALALAHTAALQAVQAVAEELPGRVAERSTAMEAAVAERSTAMEAAVAAAHRGMLQRLLPLAQQVALTAEFDAATVRLPAGPAHGTAQAAGLAAANNAVQAVWAERAGELEAGVATSADIYRPFTAAGRYVPTQPPAVPHWPRRKPWLMTTADQFRPGPPPLQGARWVRDFDEVKTLGALQSTLRSPAQTEAARFWETTAPPIYHGVLRRLAQAPERDLLRNARLFAALSQASDDAMIAVFDAKYHHGFWRPVTAIRNADLDGEDATRPDPGWQPLLVTPMHPEYPCAHCIQAAVLGAIVQAEFGAAPPLGMSTSSPSLPGVQRQWHHVNDLVQEVAQARIHGGMHFRFSTEAAVDMGRRIGALAARRWLAD